MKPTLLSFIHQSYTLKHLHRAGWKLVGISDPESVASHSWGLSLLISMLAPNHLNKTRMYEMALAHDLPEVITGDITPHDNIAKETKKEQEQTAAKHLLPPRLYEVWQEYEENETKEAQFVHMLDKLDMAIQAQLYAQNYDTQEFIQSARKAIPMELQQLLGIQENPTKPIQ